MAQSKEVVKHEDQLPAEAEEFVVGGVGFEDIGQDERRTPFMSLLQQGSKAINPGDEAHYVEGAKPGDFMSVAARRFYPGKEGLDLIPVFRRPIYVERVPLNADADEKDRMNAAGIEPNFQKEWKPFDQYVLKLRDEQDRFRPLRTERGTRLVQTYQLWALVGAPGFTISTGVEAVIFPFTSIKIKYYREFIDLADRIRYTAADGRTLVRPDLFKHRWRLTSVFEPEWKPNGSWNVRLRITDPAALKVPAPNPNAAMVRASDPLFQMAKELFEIVKGGGAQPDYSTEAEVDPNAANTVGTDPDIPF